MTEATKRKRKNRKPPVEMNLQLQAWGSRGATIAESDGRAMTIDRGIPGERVVATVDRARRPWRGVVDFAVEPSSHRVLPPCPYFARGCGGCQWQHIDYPTQLETKRELVDGLLESHEIGVRVGRVHHMNDPWRYRHTAAIAIGWEAGFRPRARRGILEIHDCLIAHPLIGRLANRLNAALRAGELPNYHGKVWLDCTVVGSPSRPTLQVVIQGIEGLTLEAHPELTAVAEKLASIDSVHSVAYRHRSGDVRPLVGELMAEAVVGGRTMWVPAGSFVQTNPDMVAVVLNRMEAALDALSVRHGADIYGGVGTLGLPLASRLERLTLVELDPAAVEAARRTAIEWGLANVELISRHAEQALPSLPPLDLAIVDPPRSGLGPAVTGALIDNHVPLILYVSCSPQSLAADLSVFQANGYRVRSLEIFDFYPQTYHVESLAVVEQC